MLQRVLADFDLPVTRCSMESSPPFLKGREHDFPICASRSLVPSKQHCLTPGAAGSIVTRQSLSIPIWLESSPVLSRVLTYISSFFCNLQHFLSCSESYLGSSTCFVIILC